MKFVVVSDIHAHAYTLYSTTNKDGVNTRLAIILAELERAADAIIAQGGNLMIIPGDIFHTRGVIDPEVLNPVRQSFERILYKGVDIRAIPGNHDLKSHDSNSLSSAIENLTQVTLDGRTIEVFNETTYVYKPVEGAHFCFVPWISDANNLRAELAKVASYPDKAEMHVFIHAGIDGVIPGMPAHGLSSAELAAYGFKRVYAGHYHNHKVMEGGAVISIGASTHQNWGDVGSRAGFLIVDTDADTVTFNDTKAPKFVDLSGLDEDDMELECPGNYVRFRGPPMTQDEINGLRDQFRVWGALGVSVEVPRAVAATRSTAPAKGRTLSQSVEAFVDGSKNIPASVDREAVKRRAIEVLNTSQTVFETA